MTDEARVSRLEKLLDIGTRPSASIAIFDPDDVPKSEAGRKEFFQSRTPKGGAVFLPDNGRERVEP